MERSSALTSTAAPCSTCAGAALRLLLAAGACLWWLLLRCALRLGARSSAQRLLCRPTASPPILRPALLQVPGRTFPVDVTYALDEVPASEYAAAAVDTAIDIHCTQPEGAPACGARDAPPAAAALRLPAACA